VAVLFRSDGIPFAKRDLAKITAAGRAGASALLLPAINPIGKLVVGNDVVELRGGLVVPGTPGLAAVHAQGQALIAGERDDVRVLWIDPDGVIVVAAGRSFNGGEIVPCVPGAVSRSVGYVDDVFVLGIYANTSEVIAASPYPLFLVHPLPVLARIVG